MAGWREAGEKLMLHTLVTSGAGRKVCVRRRKSLWEDAEPTAASHLQDWHHVRSTVSWWRASLERLHYKWQFILVSLTLEQRTFPLAHWHVLHSSSQWLPWGNCRSAWRHGFPSPMTGDENKSNNLSNVVLQMWLSYCWSSSVTERKPHLSHEHHKAVAGQWSALLSHS